MLFSLIDICGEVSVFHQFSKQLYHLRGGFYRVLCLYGAEPEELFGRYKAEECIFRRWRYAFHVHTPLKAVVGGGYFYFSAGERRFQHLLNPLHSELLILIVIFFSVLSS